MTDRELLELAAKAAGLHVGFGYAYTESGCYDLYWSHVHHQLVWHHKTAGSEYPEPVFWNPLTDDGDALRLAVKLEMELKAYNTSAHAASAKAERSVYAIYASEKGDPYAATRRAIVRAAAEIGRNT